jgi:general secretion pathway protein J
MGTGVARSDGCDPLRQQAIEHHPIATQGRRIVTTSSQHTTKTAIEGFTLVETLVAMMLMGFVLAALATMMLQWMPNWRHGMAQLQRDEQLALALEVVAEDLAAAEYVSPNIEGQEPYFDGAHQSVSFVRTALGPNASSGLELVRIVESTTRQGTMLIRRRANFAIASTETMQKFQPSFTDPVVLLRPPYRVSFAYAGADRIWHENWIHQLRLPVAIKMTLKDAGTNRTSAVSTATLLHAALPQRCIRAKSFEECVFEPQTGNGRQASQ